MHQVKLFDKHGKLKKIIPPEELEMRHWTAFSSHKTAYSNKRGPVTIPGSKVDAKYEPEEDL